MNLPYETPARMVRTGQVIKVPADNYRRGLEVDIVHHEIQEVDGERIPVVRFTGWTAQDGRVERGWGQLPDTLVLVTDDMRGHSYLTVYDRPGDDSEVSG